MRNSAIPEFRVRGRVIGRSYVPSGNGEWDSRGRSLGTGVRGRVATALSGVVRRIPARDVTENIPAGARLQVRDSSQAGHLVPVLCSRI